MRDIAELSDLARAKDVEVPPPDPIGGKTMRGKPETETPAPSQVSKAKIVSPSCDLGNMRPPGEKPDEVPHEKEKRN